MANSSSSSSSSSSSAWMLLPLLLVFLHTSSSAPIFDHELWIQIKQLGETLKKCTPDCSSDDIPNNGCHFLNLTKEFKVLQTENNQTQVCIRYFTAGLESYKNLLEKPTGSCKTDHLNFDHLERKLNNSILPTELCKSEDKLQPIISPYALHEVLEHTFQKYNAVKAFS
ncbi:uncharacterized protein LOC105354980 [Oryzias latipes]